MVQAILVWYFGILHQFGLLGVVVLMAIGSMPFPIPAELVIPPAAVVYLQDEHRDGAVILMLMVILAGTLGSFLGASLMYWVSRELGRPLIVKYGKYIFLTEAKLKHADDWMVQYGSAGIFLARLLPFVRHVISIPAGIVGMRFRTFGLMTVLGSLLSCTELAIFGLTMKKEILLLTMHSGGKIDLQHSPTVQMALHKLTLCTLLLVGLAMFCYWLLARRAHRKETAPYPPAPIA